MVSIVNKLSAKHPATLAISDTILLYHLIKVKPRLDVKVERPEMVYQVGQRSKPTGQHNIKWPRKRKSHL